MEEKFIWKIIEWRGKTKTAQIAENGVYLSGQYILSFIGSMPMNDPKIAVYVCLEKPHSLNQIYRSYSK